MLPITRDQDNLRGHHSIYHLEWQAGQFTEGAYTAVSRYPESGIVLLRAAGHNDGIGGGSQPDAP